MKYIVYQTINKINNKQYVGVHKTKDPDKFDGYLANGVVITAPSSYMKPTTPFQYAVKKYGVGAFTRTTLQVFDTSKEAFNLEAQIVNYDFLKRKDVYNVALGGGGGSQAFVPINQYTTDGKFVKKWNSVMEACEFLGVAHSSILRAEREKGSCKEFYWSRNEISDFSEYHCYKGSVCYKYSAENGKCVDIYNSMPEAAKYNNVTLQEIERAVKGGFRVRDFYYSTKLLEEYNGKPKVSLKNKTLYVYTLKGEFVIELHSTKEILEFFNIKSTNVITTSIRAERPYKEWQFSFTKEDKLPEVVNKKNIRKRVGRYTLGGDLIEEFDSIEKAKAIWGNGVGKCVNGQQKQCKGYLFRQIS